MFTVHELKAFCFKLGMCHDDFCYKSVFCTGKPRILSPYNNCVIAIRYVLNGSPIRLNQ